MKKKTTGKILSAVTAISLLAGGAVFAEEATAPGLGLDTPPLFQDGTPVVPAENDMKIKVNLVDLSQEDGLISYYKDGRRMIPVRAVAEALNYAVGWEQETERVTLTRGAQYITFSLGEDSYTFSKMAPVSLGCLPELINDGTTYVPVEFLSLLDAGYSVSAEGDTLEILQMTPVTVLSVDETGDLTVDDPLHGEVVVHLTEETVITNNGKSASAEEIKPESLIHIIYGPAMTMSIPPQTTAVMIEVNPNAVEDTEEETPGTDPEVEPTEGVAFEATVKEVLDESSVLVEMNGDDVILHVSEETNIHHVVNKRLYRIDDLEAGMNISGTISDAMTMSIPPQTTALEIILND